MLTNTKHSNIAFRKIGIVTIAAVYLLVLIGGIVRSTGSGMGCPDWPKCFGSWVPPTEVSQLPFSYKEDYALKRKQKNERLANYLDKLGLKSLGENIRNDFGGREAAFNPVKTWIEYVNRLVGVAIGLLIFLTVLRSVPFLKSDPPVFWLSLLSFILVGFQGWIGSIVVSTNLLPGTITVHMLLAIAIIMLLIYAVVRASGVAAVQQVEKRSLLNALLITAIVVSLLQVLLGTQVREAIDHAIQRFGYDGRHQWVDSLGMPFFIHRSFSWVVLLLHLYIIYCLRKYTPARSSLYQYGWILGALVLTEILAGVGMAYWSVPPFLQPVHLLLALVMVGVQFTILLLLNPQVVFNPSASAREAKAFS